MIDNHTISFADFCIIHEGSIRAKYTIQTPEQSISKIYLKSSTNTW